MARPTKTIPAGTVIHKMTVLRPGEPLPHGPGLRWLRSTSVVRCECGAEKTMTNASLLGGKNKSCGCYLQVAIGLRVKTHGLSVGKWKRTYASWQNMMRRCYEEDNDQYQNYGKRGITVCPEWHSVELFAKDMGIPPSTSHSLDRIDNSGNYCRKNCRWASKKEQAVNRRSTKFFTVDGVTRCIKDWAKEWGVSRHAAGKRLGHGV